MTRRFEIRWHDRTAPRYEATTSAMLQCWIQDDGRGPWRIYGTEVRLMTYGEWQKKVSWHDKLYPDDRLVLLPPGVSPNGRP